MQSTLKSDWLDQYFGLSLNEALGIPAPSKISVAVRSALDSWNL
jgi:hypothetical protein